MKCLLALLAGAATATAAAGGAAPDDPFYAATRRVMEAGERSEGLRGGRALQSDEQLLSACADPNDLPTLSLPNAEAPLRQPQQIVADPDGAVRHAFYYDALHYVGPVFDTILRLYNYDAPGPTIRVKPGQRMEFTIVNCLHEPAGTGANPGEAHNMYRTPNTTNLHTHGPHFNGMDPGDNILVVVPPRTVHRYTYHFGANHMPGTFWYHPHHHGSTALQTAQGASGMIIVDYPDEYPLPAQIKDLPEVQMVMHHLDLPQLRAAAAGGNDLLTDWTQHNFQITNRTTDIENLMLVNMQFLPKVQMEAGRWYRWRILHSSVQASLAFESESKNCEFELLAKDGIFLQEAPRSVPVIITSPAQRADVAVRCHNVGFEKMNSTFINMYAEENFLPGDYNYTTKRQNQVLNPYVPDLVGNFTDPSNQPVIFLVDVVPNPNPPDPPLEKFKVARPCYLVDLVGVPEDDISGETHQNRYNCDVVNCTNPDQYDLCDGVGHKYQDGQFLCYPYGPVGRGGDPTKPMPFVNGSTYINDFTVGTVREIELQMAKYHPYHQHVNPYQIVSINGENLDAEGNATMTFPARAENNPSPDPLQYDFVRTWYQIGDWHDTLQMPTDQVFVSWNVRFQIDQFTGNMIQHCHLLFHEDQGMMTTYNLIGNEGDVWEGAYDIDRTCVRAGESYGPVPPNKICTTNSDCVGIKKCKDPNRCKCIDRKCRKKKKDCATRGDEMNKWGCPAGKVCVAGMKNNGVTYKWGKCK